MRTLKDTLLAAAHAIDAARGTNCIKVWRFEDAPEELQALSENAGDEDWLAVVPDYFELYDYIPWLEVRCFGHKVRKCPVAGAVVYIGCHA